MKSPLFATLGIGAIEGVQHLPAPTLTFEYIKLGVQIILGLFAFIKMRKENKKNTNQNESL
jgi:hypothetical protein